MKMLNDSEKLEIARDFVKSVMNLNCRMVDVEDIVRFTGVCDECGSDEVDVTVNGSTDVILPEEIDRLKDKAWHVLVDIS